MSIKRLLGLTALVMFAFAGNSLLCRIALQGHHIEAAQFTALRLIAGAGLLGGLAVARGDAQRLLEGSWLSAVALFTYAAGFSFAYLTLPAGTGALVLFGAVQGSIIGASVWRGERLRPLAWAGFATAIAGLIGLLATGVRQASMGAAFLMGCAGIVWAVYSLRGREQGNPAATTTGNFLRAAALGLLLLALHDGHQTSDATGVLCAIASGAVTSGLGYTVWYAVLPHLRVTSAAVVQLSVPVIAAGGGFMILAEPITLRVLAAGSAILGGILVVLAAHQRESQIQK